MVNADARSRRRRTLPALVGLVGCAIFGALALGSWVFYGNAEDRLLRQRTSEAAVALQLSVSRIQAPLDSTARLARVTAGEPTSLTTGLQDSVGDGAIFTSAALLPVDGSAPIATLGDWTAVRTAGLDDAATIVARARTEPFVVIDLLGGSPRRLGYAVADSADDPRFVVYGERVLSADPYVRRRTDQPFTQLDYAMYLGSEAENSTLLGSSLRDLPIEGRSQSTAIAFGDQQILLVMAPIGHLSGDLFANLWWIVAAIGALVSIGFATLTRRLLERRDTAIELAAENERLYDAQRRIADTLQLSLLPQQLSTPSDVAAAVRYWPAGSANLIGGDFYDLFRVDDDRWAVSIGDVCGKGIDAAALTGLVRHTVRAASRHGTSPVDVLEAVHRALADHQPATFCTAIFGYLSAGDEPDSYRLEFALGGHPQPLLRRRDASVAAVGRQGTLLGMVEPSLTSTVTIMQPGDTLVLYTDGLTDAPNGEAVPIEEVMDLLRSDGDEPIEHLADHIRTLKRRRRPRGSADDTALLILRLDLSESPADLEPHPLPGPQKDRAPRRRDVVDQPKAAAAGGTRLRPVRQLGDEVGLVSHLDADS
jgi:serine phosphatase RsbU (regulator of sigma subunit)